MPSTPGTPLLAIPLHLLEGICEQVALCDYDRSSLFSLSLANKACCSAARRERFKCLSITVRSAEQLESDVGKRIQVLQKNNSTQYLRILKVRGRGHLSEERAALDAQANHHPFLPRHRPPEQKDWDEHKEKELLSVAQQGFFDPPEGSGRFQEGTFPKNEAEIREHDQRWAPLAKFIQTLGNLEDFIFDHGSQLPRCVLQSIHEHHPRCRLHLHTFQMNSLMYRKDDPVPMDSHDVSMALSPHLTSIRLRWYDYHGGIANYNGEAVTEMIRCHPRLKHVWWTQQPQAHGDAYRYAKSTPRPKWRGFPIPSDEENFVPFGGGQLETLIIQDPMRDGELRQWMDLTDFSKLTTLHIDDVKNSDDFDHLVNVAEGGGLGSVVDFGLRIKTGRHHQIQPYPNLREDVRIDNKIAKILASLQPLQGLRVWSPTGEKSIKVLESRHGPKLQRLYFDFDVEFRPHCFNKETLASLQRHCPQLRELKISYLRTQGDREETAIYSILGQFPLLERLVLWPYIVSTIGPHWINLQGKSLTYDDRHEVLRVGLVNSAIDEKLVRSVFDRIVSIQGDRSRLRHLRFEPRVSRGPVLMDPNDTLDIGSIAHCLAQAHICEKSANPGGGSVEIRRLEKASKVGFADAIMGTEKKQFLDQAWLDFFPDRTGKWPDKWSSFPLSESTATGGWF